MRPWSPSWASFRYRTKTGSAGAVPPRAAGETAGNEERQPHRQRGAEHGKQVPGADRAFHRPFLPFAGASGLQCRTPQERGRDVAHPGARGNRTTLAGGGIPCPSGTVARPGLGLLVAASREAASRGAIRGTSDLMRLSVFSSKPYDRHFLARVNGEEGFGHELVFFDARLEEATARLAEGSPAISPFVNDDLGRRVLAELAAHGTRLVALRSAGFNNVDLSAARDLGLTVMHVPDYSPYAVAEFTHRPGPGAQPSPVARLHARARGQLLAPGPPRLRPARQDGRDRRHRQDRRHRRRDAAQRLRLPGARLRPVPQRPAAGARRRVRGPRAAAGESDLVSLHCPLTTRRTTSSTGPASPV